MIVVFGAVTAENIYAGTAVRHVASTGDDVGNDCTNPLYPCATLQYAVNMAASGDEVRVAAGIYTPSAVYSDHVQVVAISRSVSIRGGYSASFSDPPDPTANPTILDAVGLGRVIYITSTHNVLLEGLQLRGGDVLSQSQQGGGLYLYRSTVVLNNLIITNNQAEYGGGIYAYRGSISMTHTTLANNTAGFGGAAYFQSTHGDFQANLVTGNQAALGGGGLRLYDSDLRIRGNVVSSNTAVLHGGGFYLSNSAAELSHNLIYGNQVTSTLQGWGGGLQLHNSPAILSGNTIRDNAAYTGGGIRLFDSQAHVSENLIQHNQAIFGGGLSLENGSHSTWQNNVVMSNTASDSGDGVYVTDSDPYFSHTTLTGNTTTGFYVTDNGRVHLVNSIFASHTVGIENVGGAVTVTAVLWDSNVVNTAGTMTTTGALTGSAAFAADGYHLTAVSAALDVGEAVSLTRDIDGDIRPNGGYDLGADEWWAFTAVKTANALFVMPGQVVNYAITLTNGTTGTFLVNLTDTLPGLVSYLGPLSYTSGTGGYSSGTITWTGMMSPHAPVRLWWPVQITNSLSAGTVITNTAVINTPTDLFSTLPTRLVIPYRSYLPITASP